MPRAVDSDAEDACFLSSSYGLTADDWQEDVLDAWLGRRRDGRFAAATCGLAVPRQNGKNGAIEIRELFGMVSLGEKFLHTAHEVKTARKAFIRISSFFENERKHPELAAMVKEIRKTNGQEAVILNNGGSVEFIARSRGSGRGFTVDVLVCDEAQELSDEQLAALLPTISAAPLGNPQVIITGTPPDPERPVMGEVFARVRDDGESGRDRRLAWADFGVADGPMPDVDDPRLWQACNPALGIRLSMAEVERERRLMSAETFARERLGWWGDPDEDYLGGALPYALWMDQIDHLERGSEVMIGLDLTGDRDVWLSVAWKREDDAVQVMLANDGRPVPAHRAVEECRRLRDEWGGTVASSAFGDELERAGVEFINVSGADFAAGCGLLEDAIVAGSIYHNGQESLNTAIRAATWRTSLASGERAFQLKDMPEVGPAAAAVRALWGLENYAPLPAIY